MEVVHFARLPFPGVYSIERVFQALETYFNGECSIRVVGCATPRHTKWWFVHGIVRALKNRAEVNHILGDIHYVALALPSRRTILTVHDLNRLDDLSGLRKTLFKLLYFDLPLRRCGVITAISEHTRDRLIEIFPFSAGKIVVIPDCVADGFVRVHKTFDKECPRILHVGTRPNKNLERIAEALRGVKCTLHVVGKLSERQRAVLEECGIQYTNVMYVSDEAIRQFFAEADIVLFASLAEGFGLPILEGNTVGRAVVTSNRSPMKEVASGAACLVDPTDAADIRRGLLRVIEDDEYRNSLIELGFENASRFSPRTIADQYAMLYRQVSAR